jgi:hypothetical protein
LILSKNTVGLTDHIRKGSVGGVCRDVVVNGEVAIAMVQYMNDLAAGGYAQIACTRTEGVK